MDQPHNGRLGQSGGASITSGTSGTAAPPRSGVSGAWSFALGVGLSLGLTVGGAVLASNRDEWSVLAAGGLGLILSLLAWPVASHAGRTARAVDAAVGPLHERLQTLSVLVQTVSEQQLLSDRAKTVAYRANDRDALRRAIREDLAKGDYEAALALCDEMETTFGYKQEAERVREEVREQRDAAARVRINEAMGVIEQHARAERWQAAFAEANRLAAVYPDHEEVKQMPVVIEARRQNFKTGLVDAFEQARGRDVDEAIGVLKRLDTYLTPAEGQSLQESARAVFREKLNQMKEEFARLVHDHQWPRAIRVGEEIVADYPNTQIAREVREKMASLQQRAAEEPARA